MTHATNAMTSHASSSSQQCSSSSWGSSSPKARPIANTSTPTVRSQAFFVSIIQSRNSIKGANCSLFIKQYEVANLWHDYKKISKLYINFDAQCAVIFEPVKHVFIYCSFFGDLQENLERYHRFRDGIDYFSTLSIVSMTSSNHHP